MNMQQSKKKQDSIFKRLLKALHAHGLPDEIEALVGEGPTGHPVVYASMNMSGTFGKERRMGIEIDMSGSWLRMPSVKYVQLYVHLCNMDMDDDDRRMSAALEAVVQRWSKDWSPCITPPVLLLTLFTDVSSELARLQSCPRP